MKHMGRALIIFMLIALSMFSMSVQAWDWITFHPLRAEAVARFYGTDRRSGSGETGRDTEWNLGVHFSQRGYILDPGIALFLLDFEPVYIGGKIETNTTKDSRDGNFLSYQLQLSLLRGTPGPFSFNLSALRSSNLHTTTLGSRSENITEVKTASMQWKNQAFPMQLMYTERLLDQEFTSTQSNVVSERNELLKIWALSGRSSKMDLLVEHRSMDDRIITRDQDYDVDNARLTHRLPWGTNSNLFSRLNYYDRTGFNANKRLDIDETARIQHSDNMYSFSTYSFDSVTQTITTDTHRGEIQLIHQLYDNLTSSARVQGSSLGSEVLDETRWLTGLGAHYQKQNLLFDSNINLGLELSYQETDRDSSTGLEEIVDEAHVVTLGGRIILNRRFILTPTIIVTSADGTLVFNEGFDYFVSDLTEDLTQLQVIPGGQISIGDTILVSYKAQVLPSQEFSTTFTQYNLGFILSWMSFSHYSRVSDDKLISGAGESFLNDNRAANTNIDFRWRMAGIDTFVGAERNFTEIRGFETTVYTFRQLLSWEGIADTLWNLNVVESFTESDNLDTDLYNLELSANWQPIMSLRIRPVIGVWKRVDKGDSLMSGRRDDEFMMAGFTLHWQYRKVTLDLGYHHERRTTDDRKTDIDRLVFNLRRRF